MGTFVPGTGVLGNGMVTADDPDYPKGFRNQRAPALAPRAGVAYDLRGNNKSKLHASAGVYHNAVLGGGSQGNLQGPPYFNQSTIFYNTLDNFMAPGATLAGRAVGVNGLERDAATPVAYRFSGGIKVYNAFDTGNERDVQTNTTAPDYGTFYNPIQRSIGFVIGSTKP